MHTVVVIKLGSTLPEIRKAAGADAQVVHVGDVEAALGALQSSSVDLVLLSEVSFRSPVGGFLSLLRTRLPQMSVPVIVIDLMDTEKELVVYERGASADTPPESARHVAMHELRQELLRLCSSADGPPPARAAAGPPPPAGPATGPAAGPAARTNDPSRTVAAELRRIGFNDCVERGARVIHVQTEVLGGSPLRVQSTVMEGGGILDATVRALEVGEQQLNDEIRDLIRSQHEVVLAEVRRGRYG